MNSFFSLCARLWLCTFTLTVSLGAVLLLPTTIFSNEILLMYPKSYYVKWLNGSLIHGTLNPIYNFINHFYIYLILIGYYLVTGVFYDHEMVLYIGI